MINIQPNKHFIIQIPENKNKKLIYYEDYEGIELIYILWMCIVYTIIFILSRDWV
jgi:hypothetical protein